MRASSTQSGFSAVELLVTLFIGFLFISMGFQLYTVIINRSNDENSYNLANNGDELLTRALTNGVPLYGSPAGMETFNYCPASPIDYSYTEPDTQATMHVTWWCPQPTAIPKLREMSITRTIKSTKVTYATYFTYSQ